MSLDRIHDVNGLMQLSAQPAIGTTGTASTVASNQYAGGYQFGAANGIAAGSNSTNGGAPYVPYLPKGTTTNDFQSFTTTGMITHDNMPLVLISVSTTGIALNLQPASYDGQLLTLCIQPGTTASLVSTVNTTGIGGTTSAAVQVAVATTFASTGPCVLQAHKLAQTASTNWPFVWRRIV